MNTLEYFIFLDDLIVLTDHFIYYTICLKLIIIKLSKWDIIAVFE